MVNGYVTRIYWAVVDGNRERIGIRNPVEFLV
jgi:hypothetical protein